MEDKPTGAYRLLHTADWHLGKMLSSQPREDEHAAFLTWLLSVVKAHEVDAILVAGDVFDAANPPESARRQYYNFVSDLFAQGGCKLVVIGGNHDSATQLESPQEVLRSLNTEVAGGLADEPSQRLLFLPDEETAQVAIGLVPFLRDRDLRVGKAGESASDIQSGIVAGIERVYAETAEALGKSKVPAIATGHLTVAKAKTSDSEREIHIGGLGSVKPEIFPKAFGYVALGHLHRPQATDVEKRVRYSGSPIPLSFSEWKDEKEVRLVDVTAESITNQALPIPLHRRLIQIRTTHEDLEKDIKAFEPKTAELPTWVEVVVKDSALEEDLAERVKQLCEGRDFEVLKIVRQRSTPLDPMSVGDASDDEAIGDLLDHPAEVFAHLLDQHSQLSKDETESLQLAFASLVEMDAEASAPDGEGEVGV